MDSYNFFAKSSAKTKIQKNIPRLLTVQKSQLKLARHSFNHNGYGWICLSQPTHEQIKVGFHDSR